MGWARLRTMLRYGNVFRVGSVPCLLLLLAVTLIWVYHHHLTSPLSKVKRTASDGRQHHQEHELPGIAVPAAADLKRHVVDASTKHLHHAKDVQAHAVDLRDDNTRQIKGLSVKSRGFKGRNLDAPDVKRKFAVAADAVESRGFKARFVDSSENKDYVASDVKDKERRQRSKNQPVQLEKGFLVNYTHHVQDLSPGTEDHTSARCSPVPVVNFLGDHLALAESPLCEWLRSPIALAEHHFLLYGQHVALLIDVIVDPGTLLRGGPKGGERIEAVWGQAESTEYFKLKKGFFTLHCQSPPVAPFVTSSHLNQWTAAIRCENASSIPTPSVEVRGLAIAVQRCEYVNLYHTMTDLYNAFLLMLMFSQHPDHVNILWVDAHPRGGLDDVWSTLFSKVLRAGRLPGPVVFNGMAWAAAGYDSPLNKHEEDSLPYAEEFRHFFLSRHGVDGGRGLNCSAVTFTFVWRRNYAAHPRNKAGSISRKIANEEEILQAARRAVQSGDNVSGLQLDVLPMETQLQLVADTDVLIGMHGAGLTHTLFLPPHGGLIELYPTYWSLSNRHFLAMAGWRGLHYLSWQNQDDSNELDDQRTRIPPETVIDMVVKMRRSMCENSSA